MNEWFTQTCRYRHIEEDRETQTSQNNERECVHHREIGRQVDKQEAENIHETRLTRLWTMPL